MSFIDNKYKYLNLTPRTHISVETSKDDNSKKTNLAKRKKYDSIDEGLNRLIYLGKIIKNYFPNNNYFKRRGLYNLKGLSHNKLTPFQIYLKNKKIISEKINSKKNFEPQLKSVNSEKTFKSRSEAKNILNTKRKKKLNMPILYNNTTECYFKNKYIKSIFEKNNKNKNNNSHYKTLMLTETNFNSKEHKKDKNNIRDLINFKYLLRISNFSRNKSKKKTNDFLYEKEKMLILNKQKALKKKKYNNLFNELKSFQDNVNAKTITEENYKNNYNQIPLIDLSNFSKKHNQFYNLIIRNNLKNNISNRNKK